MHVVQNICFHVSGACRSEVVSYHSGQRCTTWNMYSLRQLFGPGVCSFLWAHSNSQVGPNPLNWSETYGSLVWIPVGVIRVTACFPPSGPSPTSWVYYGRGWSGLRFYNHIKVKNNSHRSCKLTNVFVSFSFLLCKCVYCSGLFVLTFIKVQFIHEMGDVI